MSRLQKLRDRYEAHLDAAEKARAAYHQEIRDAYGSGTPLRDIAADLGLSHQRVHQIVGAESRRAASSGRR